MTLFSLLIPLGSVGDDPARILAEHRRKPDAERQIVVAGPVEAITRIGAADTGETHVVTPDGASASDIWLSAFSAATGRYVGLVRPADTIEPDVIAILRFIEARAPDTDAFAWNALTIQRDVAKGDAASVAIPTGYSIIDFDKTDLLKAFFLWEGSHNIPKMPFGLSHGILHRRLAEAVADTIRASGRNPDLPQWEWAARAILIGSKFAFCPRPLSVQDFRAATLPQRRDTVFPFHSGIGVTAGIGEICHALFAEMGADWAGMEENFVRAATIDCMLETDPQRFEQRSALYREAFSGFLGGALAPLFQPRFAGTQPPDRRRGLQGTTLMIDRHIAGARDAPEFYAVIRNFLAPIGVICGAATL